MHKYRDPQREIDSARKISWINKQAMELPESMQMRLATPRPTGKLPGMGGVAKNPFGNAKSLSVKAPKPPSVPKIKTASLRSALGEIITGGEKIAGYSHEYYMKNRQRIKQRNKQYRLRNAAKLRIARQRYNREIASGARRKAKRVRSGTQYLTYGGF